MSASVPLDLPHATARLSGRDGTGLTVILPGLRYGPERPLLAAMAQIAAARGHDVLAVSYRYAEDDAFLGLPEDEQIDRIGADGAAILTRAREMAGERPLRVVGKSLGTVAMGGAAARVPAALAGAELIWLTPSLVGTDLPGQMAAIGRPGLVVLGTEDPAHRPEVLDRLRSIPGLALHLVEGADHGFDHADGPDAARTAVADAAAAVAAWIDGAR